MHDVACEFACVVGCAETIGANVLNSQGFTKLAFLVSFLSKKAKNKQTKCLQSFHYFTPANKNIEALSVLDHSISVQKVITSTSFRSVTEKNFSFIVTFFLSVPVTNEKKPTLKPWRKGVASRRAGLKLGPNLRLRLAVPPIHMRIFGCRTWFQNRSPSAKRRR